MTWVPSTYDPELNLLYFGTGNPQPVIAGQGPQGRQPLHRIDRRAESRTPENSSGTFSRRRTTRTIGTPCKRPSCSMAKSTASRAKLLAQASRNGWFFVLDRTNGKNLSSSEFVKTNWTLGRRCEGPADSESG